jgi:phosphoglycerate dehydrogenase-like enzyme
MNVLILGKEQDAHEYKSYLTEDFPEVNFFSVWEESEVGDLIEKADVLVCLRCSDGFLRRARNLKWIQCMISGTNYIEELPSFQARKDILLTSSRRIHGPQMSELCIMLMIALNRKFPRFVLNQQRRVWDRWPTSLLWNKKIGILGIGVIGEAIARKCKAFEMTVLGIDVIRRELDCVDEFYGLEGLSQVAAKADYFVSVVPATPENEKTLNAGFFSRMKPTAFFLSLGRGEVVDEDALIDALRERRIAGAALDTFCQEPLSADSPFWGLDNVIITPHVGGMSDIYVQQAVKIFQENLRQYLKGERRNLLNGIPRT